MKEDEKNVKDILVDEISKKVLKVVNKKFNAHLEKVNAYIYNMDHDIYTLRKKLYLIKQELDSIIENKKITAPTLIEIKSLIDAHSLGVQNVYSQFSELEVRQKDLEDLINSDRLQDIISLIPTNNDLDELYKKLQKSKIGDIKDNLENIQNVLEHLNAVFNY